MSELIECGGHCHCSATQSALCNAEKIVSGNHTQHPNYFRAVMLVDAARGFRTPLRLSDGYASNGFITSHQGQRE